MMSPILAPSIKGLGWGGAFFVMAGLLVVVCFLGFSFDPNTPEGSSEGDRCESKQGDKKRRKLSKNPEYLLTVFVTTFVILGNSVPQVHMWHMRRIHLKEFFLSV